MARGLFPRRSRTGDRTPQDELNSTAKGILIGATVCVLACLGTTVGYALFENRQDAQEEQERLIRSVEFCHDNNRQVTKDRDLFLSQPGQLAANFFGSTPEEVAELEASPGYDAYVQFIVDQKPYSVCTVRCVIQARDPAREDCPPADNEEGVP